LCCVGRGGAAPERGTARVRRALRWGAPCLRCAKNARTACTPPRAWGPGSAARSLHPRARPRRSQQRRARASQQAPPLGSRRPHACWRSSAPASCSRWRRRQPRAASRRKAGRLKQ
jgi:hypothetical protein